MKSLFVIFVLFIWIDIVFADLSLSDDHVVLSSIEADDGEDKKKNDDFAPEIIVSIVLGVFAVVTCLTCTCVVCISCTVAAISGVFFFVCMIQLLPILPMGVTGIYLWSRGHRLLIDEEEDEIEDELGEIKERSEEEEEEEPGEEEADGEPIESVLVKRWKERKKTSTEEEQTENFAEEIEEEKNINEKEEKKEVLLPPPPNFTPSRTRGRLEAIQDSEKKRKYSVQLLNEGGEEEDRSGRKSIPLLDDLKNKV